MRYSSDQANSNHGIESDPQTLRTAPTHGNLLMQVNLGCWVCLGCEIKSKNLFKICVKEIKTDSVKIAIIDQSSMKPAQIVELFMGVENIVGDTRLYLRKLSPFSATLTFKAPQSIYIRRC